MNCLIIKNDGIGDLILASGIIASISEHFNGNVDLVTCKDNEEIAYMLYGIKNYYFVSRDNITIQHFDKSIEESKYTMSELDKNTLNILRNNKYDYAICLRRYIRQSTLVIMAQLNSFNKFCAWQFPTNATLLMAETFSKDWIRYQGDIRTIPEQEYYKEFVESILNVAIDVTPRLNLPILSSGERQSKSIGVVLGGKSSRWPNSYWEKLVLLLIEDEWEIYLFGGNDSVDIANMLFKKMERIHNYVNRIDFKESIQVLNGLTALIGNDTGFTHFASLIVPRCIIILGGGTFKRFFPWINTKSQYVIYYGLSCFDCDWQCKYEQKKCIDLIQPELVFQYFCKIIEEKNVSLKEKNLSNKKEVYTVAWRRGLGSSYDKRL